MISGAEPRGSGLRNCPIEMILPQRAAATALQLRRARMTCARRSPCPGASFS
jgi:hypothetical protein